MVEWVALGAAVIGGVSSIMGGRAAAKGADAAAQAAERREASIRRATKEKISRIREQRDAYTGDLFAKVAGAGVDVQESRSLLEIRMEALNNIAEEIQFTGEAGVDAAQLAALEGDAAEWGAKGAQWRAVGGVAQAAGSIAQTGQTAGWWT